MKISKFSPILCLTISLQLTTMAAKLEGKLTVFHAGSLSVPFKKMVSAFNKEHPQVEILLESAGSRVCARKISDLGRPCDVMASADYTVIDLDEPMASLDVQAKAQTRSLLRKLNTEGQTIIHVTHIYEEALALADQLGIIEAGFLVQSGTPETIFQHPSSSFVAQFSGIKNFYRGTLERISNDLALFRAGDIAMEIATEAPAGVGCVILRSQDITLSTCKPSSSARTYYYGTITDIEPVRLGVEIHVDISVPMVAHITTEAHQALNLQIGQEIGISIKASAPTYLETAGCV